MSIRKRFSNLVKNSYWARFISWIVLLNLIDLLAMSGGRKTSADTVKKTVVFCRLDGIGDLVIWTTVFEAIEKAFPSDSFRKVLVAGSGAKGVADHFSLFDEKIYLNRNRLATDPVYRYRSMKAVRNLDADIFINPTISRDFLWADSVGRCTRATSIIGSSGIGNRMLPLMQLICDSWYSKLIPVEADAATRHASITDRSFAKAAWGVDVGAVPPYLPLPNRDIARPAKDFAVIFVGAQFASKRWPIERFAEVAESLSKAYDLELVLAGGPGEEFLSEQFRALSKTPIRDTVGKLSLTELADLMRHSRLVITNDTSAAHIATAVKAPAVIVCSGAHTERFLPYPSDLQAYLAPQATVVHKMECFGCEWNCIYTKLPPDAPKPCIDHVTVTDVMESVHAVLGAKA